MSLPEWVKGREFAAWIAETCPDWRAQLTSGQYRAINRMLEHDQACASLRVVDEICVQLGLHINEIPEEYWTASPQSTAESRWKGCRGAPPEIRQAALRDIANGEPLRAVSAKYRVSTSAIQSWKRRAA